MVLIQVYEIVHKQNTRDVTKLEVKKGGQIYGELSIYDVGLLVK